jgi:hypothetical protein
MTEADRSKEALYAGTWRPCRILDDDASGGRVLVKVVDEAGLHQEWLPRAQIRQRGAILRRH